MIGANVVKMYNNPLMPMGTVVLMPTVVFVLNTVSQRPTKKGKRHVQETGYSMLPVYYV